MSSSATDRTLPNEALYNEWASTYDTDGNVLQAVDDHQMHEMLPRFLQLVKNAKLNDDDKRINILDLGCGTGRNTTKLLEFPWKQDVHIDAWDASQGMLNVAKIKCDKVQKSALGLSLQRVDFSEPSKLPCDSLGTFDAVLSTLVLEHLPVTSYLSVVAAALKSGGYALISNMHADMGAMTRAGYKTKAGERIKGSSFIHTVDGTVQAASENGLEVVWMQGDCGPNRSVREVAVTEDMLRQGIVGDRGKKWVGIKIWFGMVLKKV